MDYPVHAAVPLYVRISVKAVLSWLACALLCVLHVLNRKIINYYSICIHIRYKIVPQEIIRCCKHTALFQEPSLLVGGYTVDMEGVTILCKQNESDNTNKGLDKC